MKRANFGKTLSLAMMLVLISFCVKASNYYVVIGSFREKGNAARLAQAVRDDFKDASYSFNKERKVYFVHVIKTDRKEEAQHWSAYLKNKKGFKDAWVFTGTGTEVALAAEVAAPARQPRFTPAIAEVTSTEDLVLASTEGKENLATYGLSNYAAAWTYEDGISFLRNAGNFKRMASSSDMATARQFKLIVEDPDGNMIPAEVSLVNFEKSKRLASFKSGEEVAIRGTRRGQMIAFVCEVLGYGMETRMFNIDQLGRGRDIVKNEDGVWEVHIKLKEMEVYDQAILYNTTFHRDATVLETSSREELDDLVSMMSAHPEYKIVIHSHCNKGTRRSIALTGDTYFDAHTVSVRKGSDRFLTRERARLIRNYLADHGIEKNRVDVVGWGSTQMLVKPSSEDVSLNERIEVELVSNHE